MPGQKPSLVKIYFMNGNTAVFQREKVVFMRDGGELFMLNSDMIPVYCTKKTIEVPTAMVNWRAVSWVREYEEVLD